MPSSAAPISVVVGSTYAVAQILALLPPPFPSQTLVPDSKTHLYSTTTGSRRAPFRSYARVLPASLSRQNPPFGGGVSPDETSMSLASPHRHRFHREEQAVSSLPGVEKLLCSSSVSLQDSAAREESGQGFWPILLYCLNPHRLLQYRVPSLTIYHPFPDSHLLRKT